jgi:type II secretory pathway component PulK
MKAKKNGYAYVTVMMVLSILLIFITMIMALFNSNFLQSKSQEKNIQSYYLARSGIDLGVAALMLKGSGGDNDTLLYKDFSSVSKPNVASTPTLNQTLTLGNGIVEIKIHALDISGERWVEVQAIGTLSENNVSKKVILQFLVDNPAQQKWN